MILALASTSLGPLILSRSFSQLDMAVSILDIGTSDSMLPPKSHHRLGLAVTVFGFTHLDFSSLLQVFAQPESPHSVFSRSRSGLTASAPGGMLSGFLLPLRSSSQLGFSLTAFGFQHLGLVVIARNMARLDLLAFAIGSSRCDSLPSALAGSLSGPLLSLRSSSCMGLPPSVPRHVSVGSPLLSRSFGRFELVVPGAELRAIGIPGVTTNLRTVSPVRACFRSREIRKLAFGAAFWPFGLVSSAQKLRAS